MFYVGKGTRNRCHSHLRQSHNGAVTVKFERLKALGLNTVVTILAGDLTESQAFTRERYEIAARTNLCNVQPGTLSWEDRHRRMIKAKIAKMPRAARVPLSMRWLHKIVLRNLARHLVGELGQLYNRDGTVEVGLLIPARTP